MWRLSSNSLQALWNLAEAHLPAPLPAPPVPDNVCIIPGSLNLNLIKTASQHKKFSYVDQIWFYMWSNIALSNIIMEHCPLSKHECMHDIIIIIIHYRHNYHHHHYLTQLCYLNVHNVDNTCTIIKHWTLDKVWMWIELSSLLTIQLLLLREKI